MSRFATALAALAAFLLLAACGEEPKEPEFPNDLLTRVPADTPYVIASGEPVSEEVMQAWQEQVRPAMDLARLQIDEAIGQLEAEQPALAAQLMAVMDEILTLAEQEERAKIGIEREDRIVIYGNGLMPVVRLTVSDPEAFRSFLGRLGAKSGVGMGSTTYQGKQISRLAMDPVVILGALDDGELAVGVSSLDGEQAMLEHLFGESASGETLADSGAMSALVEDYGFMSVGAGYMDLPRLVSLIIGNGEVPGLLDHFDAAPEELSPECRGELVALTGKMPRMVFGYDEMTESSMAMRWVLELESDIAEAMSGWTVPVPGLGAETDAKYVFGMSLDGTKAAQTVKDWLKAAGERQYQCSFLAETPWKESATQINVAPLYMVGNPKGFMFQLNELEIRDLETQDFTASASAVAVFDNAQTLAGMVRMMAPSLQGMEIPTDGSPIQVPAEAVPDLKQPIWLASTQTTLSMALGEGSDTRVTEALNAESVTPPPFVHFDFDAGWFYTMLADWMPKIAREAAAADAEIPDAGAEAVPEGDQGAEDESQAGAGESAPADGGLDEKELAEIEKAAEMMRLYGEILGRVDYSIRFTGKGVEVSSSATFKND